MKTTKLQQAPEGGSLRRRVRAFRVDVTDWPEATSIVRTVTPARAKFLAWDSARDAGYKLPFGRFRVKRAPIFDEWHASLKAGRLYAIGYVESMHA